MNKTKNKGFLLIEVMVATAVLTFGLIYTSRAFLNCLRIMSQVENYTLGLALAEDKFFDLETSKNPNNITQAGIFTDNPEFNYNLDINASEANTAINNINLQANWKKGGKNGRLELNTCLLINNEKE